MTKADIESVKQFAGEAGKTLMRFNRSEVYKLGGTPKIVKHTFKEVVQEV